MDWIMISGVSVDTFCPQCLDALEIQCIGRFSTQVSGNKGKASCSMGIGSDTIFIIPQQLS